MTDCFRCGKKDLKLGTTLIDGNFPLAQFDLCQECFKSFKKFLKEMKDDG